jgi:hypothetical protein
MGKTYTCPTSGEDLVGCGHTFTAEPDSEGIIDCPNCGMWFTPSKEVLRVLKEKAGEKSGDLLKDDIEAGKEIVISAVRDRMTSPGPVPGTEASYAQHLLRIVEEAARQMREEIESAGPEDTGIHDVFLHDEFLHGEAASSNQGDREAI